MNRFTLLSLLLVVINQNVMASEQIPDPTMPAHYQNVRPSASTTSLEVTDTQQPVLFDWVLNSTLISPYQKIAIINGQHLKVNDQIDGATIKRITHQQVILDYDGQSITLSLHQSFISQIKQVSPL